MITRRTFVASVPWLLAGPVVLSGCADESAGDGYEEVAERTWHVSTDHRPEGDALRRELVRCATLAPSSHNTQCWKFALTPKSITILPDLSRRCPAVDPDDHHLFVSLGCAAENLVQAAAAYGFNAEPHFDATTQAIKVPMLPGKVNASPLFKAIAERQSTRGDYDGKPLSNDELRLLERAGSSNSVRMLILTERTEMERVSDFVVQGNTSQMADPAFIKELKEWIRFNSADAVRTRDGLYSVCTGNPNIPSWIGDLAFRWILTPKSENEKYAEQIRSSSGLAVFIGQKADKAEWIEVGRCYERFALQATAMGVRNAFLNQPVEVPSIRTAFADALGLTGQRPDLVVRFGRGPTLPRSLRRGVEAVMV